MRKHIYIILLAVFVLPLAAGAQPGKRIRQQIEELRRNIYTREMALTDAELTAFWPIFKNMQKELEDIHKQQRKERIRIMDNYANLSDDDVSKGIDLLLALEQQAFDVKKKYYLQFKTVIPVKKVALLPKAERAFKAELLRRFKELHNDD